MLDAEQIKRMQSDASNYDGEVNSDAERVAKKKKDKKLKKLKS